MIPDGWDEVRLGDLGYTFGGLTGKSAKDFGVGSATFVTFMNVMSNVVLSVEGVELVDVRQGESQNQLRARDVIFNGSSETPEEVGFGATVPDELDGVYLNSFCFGFRCHPDAQFDSEFFAYLTRSPIGRGVIRPMAQGSTRYNIAKSNLLNGRFLLPPLAEQQSIAEALSDADALVESLDALIAKKRDMKQAAMQRFMAPGSTLSGATMVRLGDVVQVRKGEPITESTAIPGDVPVIAGGKDAAYHCARWNRDGLTVTVSASGANAGYVKLRKGRLWASDCSTVSESPEYDVRYVAAQLEVRQSKLYQSQFGGAQPHVRPNDIAAIEVCWVDVAQQQMIGEMIADVDAEIDALVAQREKAELVKQGMMQELLSGRVRLV